MVKERKRSRLEVVQEQLEVLQAEASEVEVTLKAVEEQRKAAALRGETLPDDKEPRQRLAEIERSMRELREAESVLVQDVNLAVIKCSEDRLRELAAQIVSAYGVLGDAIQGLCQQHTGIRRDLSTFRQERDRLTAMYQALGAQAGDFPVPQPPESRQIRRVLAVLHLSD